MTTMKISARSAPWRSAAALVASTFLLLAPHSAFAQARLDAQYDASLAGIVVGKGNWVIEIHDDSYVATAQGGTSGLMKSFAQGSGTSYAQGREPRAAHRAS